MTLTTISSAIGSPSIDGLPTEIIPSIARYCIPNSGGVGFIAFGSTNKCYRGIVQGLLERELTQLCPGLIIPCNLGDERTLPDKLELFKCFWRYAPFVEDGAGLTLAPICNGITLGQRVTNAQKAGVGVMVLCNVNLSRAQEVIEQEASWKLITNGPVIGACNKDFEDMEKLVLEVGFDATPEASDYFQLLVYEKLFNLEICRYRQETFGVSSTKIGDRRLAVWSCEPPLPMRPTLAICYEGSFPNKEWFCAGGVKKLRAAHH